MGSKLGYLYLAILLVVITAWQSFFIVDQTERAIKLQFGKPVGEAIEPGLHFKLPFGIQTIRTFDIRLLTLDANPTEIITKDKKTLVVDYYTKWRIVDLMLFYTQTQGLVVKAEQRLENTIVDSLREALGRYTLTDIVSETRSDIMDEVRDNASEVMSGFGIEVVDMRIKRTDLPEQNETAIFERMRAERERQAKRYRSEGREEAEKIRAQADKERAILLAQAQRDAEVLLGQGEAEAIRIYAEALGQSPDFYIFKRSLEAYIRSMENNTSIILTPDSEFLQYMR